MNTTLPTSTKSTTAPVASARSKSKLNTTIMKEQHDNISEKMEGGIRVRRYEGKKIEM
jgi:hypothetical protein